MFMLNELLIKNLSNKVDINTSEIQSIKDAEVYSTSEIKTNKIWKNGESIYRKIIHGSASNTTNLDISNYIDNYNEMTDMIYKYSIEGDGNVYFGNVNKNDIEQSIFVGGNNTQIIFRGSRNFSNFDITLEYTKTTD